jgi:hypothetical protein
MARFEPFSPAPSATSKDLLAATLTIFPGLVRIDRPQALQQTVRIRLGNIRCFRTTIVAWLSLPWTLNRRRPLHLFWHITQPRSKKRARSIMDHRELFALDSPNSKCLLRNFRDRSDLPAASTSRDHAKAKNRAPTRQPRPIGSTPRYGLIDHIKSSVHRTFHDRRGGRSNSPVLISLLISAGRGRDAGPAQVSFTAKNARIPRRIDAALPRCRSAPSGQSPGQNAAGRLIHCPTRRERPHVSVAHHYVLRGCPETRRDLPPFSAASRLALTQKRRFGHALQHRTGCFRSRRQRFGRTRRAGRSSFGGQTLPFRSRSASESRCIVLGPRLCNRSFRSVHPRLGNSCGRSFETIWKNVDRSVILRLLD